ncbi:hypothetical protein ScalyP_jg2929 [Parmales sp. scaly parma]|nr:hypothetical protein ScalyP_jg2929 [Parmales sp. scaly parma]|tara:strand:- start:459 stop:1097 length:639 start_codon:yes stop_codon:yes gene_type:complete
MAVDDTQFQGEQMLRERMAVIQKARDMELLAREKIERELRHNEAAMVNDIATQKKIWEKEDEFEDVGDVELAANVKREREEALNNIEKDFEISNAVILKRRELAVLLTKQEVYKSLQANEKMLVKRREKVEKLKINVERALTIIDQDLMNVRRALLLKEEEVLKNSPQKPIKENEEEEEKKWVEYEFDDDGLGELASDEEWEYYSEEDEKIS